MIDFSDTLLRGDIVFEDTSMFKIRNLLKTEKGENPLCPQVGFDTKLFFENKVGTGISLSSSITQYLSSFRAEFSGISANLDSRGKFTLQIHTNQEILTLGQNFYFSRRSQ